MKNNKPRIQLSIGDKEWKKTILGEISEIKTGPFGSALHAKDYVVSGTPIITTEHFKNGELPPYMAELPQVSIEDYERLSSYRLKHGDLVFSRVGSVDINALVTKVQNGWLFSGRVLRVRPIGNIDGSYLHYLLETTLVKNDILSRAVGQTMPSINTEILKNTQINLSTDVQEQVQIGSFFKDLDDTIALHQQELEALKQTKQGFLQKMFPKEGETVPKLRFKECDGAWVRNKFENVLKSHAFKPYMANAVENGTYPVIQQGDNPIQGLSNGTPFENYMDVILFGDHTVSIYKPRTPFFVATDGIKILSADGIERNLLIPLLERYRPKSQGYKRHYTILKNEFVSYPTEIEEQWKIGDFFSQLDAVIELKEKELEALKETKKGFLQKMFV